MFWLGKSRCLDQAPLDPHPTDLHVKRAKREDAQTVSCRGVGRVRVNLPGVGKRQSACSMVSAAKASSRSRGLRTRIQRALELSCNARYLRR